MTWHFHSYIGKSNLQVGFVIYFRVAKNDLFTNLIGYVKNLFAIVYGQRAVAQRIVTRRGMTFPGNSLSTMEISGPWPLGQANLDARHAHAVPHTSFSTA